MVMCLELGADLRMAQLMPLPLTVSCFSRIQIGFTFLVLTHLGSPVKRPLNVCRARAGASINKEFTGGKKDHWLLFIEIYHKTQCTLVER